MAPRGVDLSIDGDLETKLFGGGLGVDVDEERCAIVGPDVESCGVLLSWQCRGGFFR